MLANCLDVTEDYSSSFLLDDNELDKLIIDALDGNQEFVLNSD